MFLGGLCAFCAAVLRRPQAYFLRSRIGVDLADRCSGARVRAILFAASFWGAVCAGLDRERRCAVDHSLLKGARSLELVRVCSVAGYLPVVECLIR